MKHRRDREGVDQTRKNQCGYRTQEDASDSINSQYIYSPSKIFSIFD